MAHKTTIAWTDSTFNGWIGCTAISRGCDNCYAAAMMDTRLHRAKWGPGEPRVRTSEANWEQMRRWERNHARFEQEHGRKRRVFCFSQADVFDNEAPIGWFVDFLELCRTTPHLIKQLLTKRIGNVVRRLQEALEHVAEQLVATTQPGAQQALQTDWQALRDWLIAWLAGRAPSHIWIGATVVDQVEADRDIPKLLRVPAALRFLSLEPLLGSVDVSRWLKPLRSDLGDAQAGAQALDWSQDARVVDWVIVGGESGRKARPMDPLAVAGLRRQCEEADTPMFFKQWGGRTADAGGCLLDGAELKQWPVVLIQTGASLDYSR